MPVTTNKSSAITSRDAGLLANPVLANAVVQEFVGDVEALTTDSIGSKYIFGQVPSNARISRVLLSCDDSGTTGAIDIGIYKTTEDGGAVVDADFFASAQLLTTALVNSDVSHESGVYGIEDTEQFLWQALGLSVDPGIMYDIVATTTAVAEAQATIVLRVQYVL